MRLMVLGIDHRSAPTSVREALAFGDEARDRALDALRSNFPDSEFVLLSTCNRVEIYAAAEESPPGVEGLVSFLAGSHGLSGEQVTGHAIGRHDEAAVEHLFRVAAGLESLVTGEGQILGQVRGAYKAAADRQAAGPILHAVFQQALRAGKRAREDTGLGRGKLSVASVAIDLARDVFDRFEDKAVLVIGAGQMGALVLQHLRALRPGSIVVTNRDRRRAEAAAAGCGGRVIPFERLDDALTEADLIISTTAAPEPIVTHDRFASIQRARHNRLALIVDLAVPRDFDPRIGGLERVMLYNVDDLRARVERDHLCRLEQERQAAAIVRREAAACWAALRHRRHTGALLRQLGEHADDLIGRELERLFAARPDFTDPQRDAIARAMARFLNRFLHRPRAVLHSAAAADGLIDPATLLDAARRVFGLADAASAQPVSPRQQRERCRVT